MSKISTPVPNFLSESTRHHHIGPTSPFLEEIEQAIPERFEKIVRLYPDRLAVKMGDHALTYEELNRLANRIAHAIVEKRGIGSEPIALLFEHGIGFITAILAVQKAGKFYVGLDPAFPAERVKFILKDSATQLIVTNKRNLGVAQTFRGDQCGLLNIEDINETTPSENLCIAVSPDELSCVCFTSGSEGQAKGVKEPHRVALHTFSVNQQRRPTRIEDRLSLIHSLCFGSAKLHLQQALLNGASLFPFDLKSEGIHRMVQWLEQEQITVLHVPPAAFRQFAHCLSGQERLTSLRLIYLSGAPITKQDFELYKKHFSKGTLFGFHMASTETRSIGSAIVDHSFRFPEEGAPVGYAFPDKNVMILAENGQEIGPNQVGEIAVKSRYLNLGYWNRPDLTNRKFFENPEDGDERIYLTGDLGKMLPDGFLIHLGRKDFMVKIRGYRVEMAEVEKALRGHGAVKDVVVVARQSDAGDARLVAYFTSSSSPGPTVSELRSFVMQRLPDYMIPSAYVRLDAIPLSSNGKVDRQALPPSEQTRPELANIFVAPRDRLESQLVKIWEEILGLGPVGVNDNFFDLGGHSLLAVHLFAEIGKTFGKEIPVATLFQAPTIEQLANVLRARPDLASSSSLVVVQPGGSKPPFFCAHGANGYLHLARYLGPNQPFYGLAQHLNGRQVRHTKIEEIAAHYIEEIRTIQPQGPYFIGGHSLGGTIAFEMAQQLTSQGQEVALLAVLDSAAPNRVRENDEGIFPVKGVRSRVKLVACKIYHLLGVSLPPSLQTFYIDKVVYGMLYPRASRDYRPQVYRGPVIYLKSRRDPRERFLQGWQQLIKGELEIYTIPGDHNGMLREPHVQALGDTLRTCLTEAQRKLNSDPTSLFDFERNRSALTAGNIRRRDEGP